MPKTQQVAKTQTVAMPMPMPKPQLVFLLPAKTAGMDEIRRVVAQHAQHAHHGFCKVECSLQPDNHRRPTPALVLTYVPPITDHATNHATSHPTNHSTNHAAWIGFVASMRSALHAFVHSSSDLDLDLDLDFGQKLEQFDSAVRAAADKYMGAI